MDPNILKDLNAARAAREACVVIKDLSDGRDRLIMSGHLEQIDGELGEALNKAFSSGKSAAVTVEGHPFFINTYIPSLRIVVIGAAHISQALVAIAKSAGFDIEVIDPRTAFATAERFPDVRLDARWPEEALKDRPLDAYCAMVAVTHDPKIDDYALIEALKAGCLYIGALGSAKTHTKRIARLIDTGLQQVDVERIASPIGLDIGAAAPGEIAVAIMAEIIATLRQPNIPNG